MRVYEFSKQLDISNKQALEALQEAGFSVSSHMAVITQPMMDALTQKFTKKTPEAVSHPQHTAVPQSPSYSDQSVQKKSMNLSNNQSKNNPPIAQSSSENNQDKRVQQNKVSPNQHRNQGKPALHNVKSQQVGPKPHIQTRNTATIKEAVEIQEPYAVLESQTLGDLALSLQKPVNDLIVTMLKWGMLSNKNQIIDTELVKRIAEFYQIQPRVPEQKKQNLFKKEALETGTERLPIVVVMGHVDHGKTTLLDYIRNTRVALREKGGITQHLGAYQAHTEKGDVVFLDTPGHEAFSKIRSRGAQVADIAILVVAADDSIMPQTLEAIKHAKESNLPIIVAINKIDKVDASRMDAVKRDLAQHDLLPEEWGGQTICVPISAKTGQGVDQLLDLIVLQSQLLELKADPSVPAHGYVLESKIEKGRGPVATILCLTGTIQMGDYFTCGTTSGKVSSIVDSFGKRLQKAGPSIPVLVAGFDALPNAGDVFQAMEKGSVRKSQSEAESRNKTQSTQFSAKNSINILVKTDTNSSKEALIDAISKLSKKSEKGFNVVSTGIGPVTESDVMMAKTAHATIITLHVKADSNALALAQRSETTIEYFDVIYHLLNRLQEIADSKKEIKYISKKIGEAVIRKIFDIKNLGVIAGCYIKEGLFTKDGSVVVWHGKQKVGQAKITSLQRDKKTVKEVHAGFECGFMVDQELGWQVDDRVECFIQVPDKK